MNCNDEAWFFICVFWTIVYETRNNYTNKLKKRTYIICITNISYVDLKNFFLNSVLVTALLLILNGTHIRTHFSTKFQWFNIAYNSIKPKEPTSLLSPFFISRFPPHGAFSFTEKKWINSRPGTRLKAGVNEVSRSSDEKSRILYRDYQRRWESSTIVRFAFKLMLSQTTSCFAESRD